MRRLIFILLVFTSLCYPSDFNDNIVKYYPPESTHRSLHTGISSLIVIGSYYGYRKLDQMTLHERIQRLLYPISNNKKMKYLTGAIITSLAVGTLKEFVDSFKNDDFNMRDMNYK